MQTGSGAHPASFFSSYWGALLGVKQLQCEADHSSPPSAEVRYEWSYALPLAVSLHGVHRDSFAILHACCLAGLLLHF